MSQELQDGMRCAEFEALLTEAVEGGLSAQLMQLFRGHAQTCPQCRALFAEASTGYESLRSLVEIEPPTSLLHDILAATSEADKAEKAATPSAWQRFREQLAPYFAPVFGNLMQPRVAGSGAMAFFSLTLLLNITGVRVTDVKRVDLTPHAIKTNVERTYIQASARVVKYYDSLRFVYEVESKLRDLRQAEPAEQKPVGKPKRDKNNRNMSQQPGSEQNQNYSQQTTNGMLEAIYRIPQEPAIQPSLGCQSRRRSQV